MAYMGTSQATHCIFSFSFFFFSLSLSIFESYWVISIDIKVLTFFFDNGGCSGSMSPVYFLDNLKFEWVIIREQI